MLYLEGKVVNTFEYILNAKPEFDEENLTLTYYTTSYHYDGDNYGYFPSKSLRRMIEYINEDVSKELSTVNKEDEYEYDADKYYNVGAEGAVYHI